MNQKAVFIKEISHKDPSGNDCELALFRHENGGMFAIDTSYIEQCTGDDETPLVQDPLNDNSKVFLIGV